MTEDSSDTPAAPAGDTDPPAGAVPPPPGAIPPPPGAIPPPPGGPVYRDDLRVRVEGPWTRNLQLAFAALFAVNAVVSLVLFFVFQAESRRIAEQQLVKSLEQRGQVVDPQQLKQLVDFGMIFGLVFLVLIVIIGLLIAVGSLQRRWTWLWWVDIVLLGIGTLSGGVTLSLALAGVSQAVAGQLAWTAVSWLAGAALFIWGVVATVRFGPWGQPLAPAPLEP